MTFFDTLSRSYADVDTSKGIDTMQFLEACEGLVKMFDLLGSSAFSVVQSDMNGNIKKIRDRFLTNPTANDTLENLTATETPEKKRTATEGLLWLTRGLDFTAKALRRSLDDPSEELNVSFTKSYEVTLKKFHSFVVRPVFALAMKACPYRKDFLEKLGGDNETTKVQMEKWLSSLEAIVAHIITLFQSHPEYIKGM
ncbi:glycolipid transfer protein domain-containing protein [Umbelopsis sp. PMI_123]|nr:glycolipid transfer protein domain-containing protein [Umbelopsis sp. PMI_123]